MSIQLFAIGGTGWLVGKRQKGERERVQYLHYFLFGTESKIPSRIVKRTTVNL